MKSMTAGEFKKQTRKRYGRAWKRIRDTFKKNHPYCQKCGKPTEEIHHILPLCKGGTHERSNLMALCKNCHSEIHLFKTKERLENGNNQQTKVN